MKKIIALFLTFTFLSSASAAESFKAPDMMIDTKLDFDWSGILVSRIRRFLKNTGQPDPFRQTFKEPIMVSENVVEDYLDPSAKELMTDLGRVIGINILNGKTQVHLHGLQYDVRGFKLELDPSEEQSDELILNSSFSASNIKVAAKKVTLSLLVPGKKSLPLINIDIINPVITASGENLMNFSARLKLQDKKDMFKVLMEQADFDSMAKGLLAEPGKIKLNFDGIIIPKLSIRAGNSDLNFDSQKIEQLLMSKREGIKGLLIAQVASMLQSGLGSSMLKAIERVQFPKEYWIDSNILYSQLKLKKFASDESGKQVEIELPGDFCTKEKFQVLKKECVNNKVTQPVRSLITQSNHEDSVRAMKDHLYHGDANIVVSISEDYVNKLLAATLDANLWDDMLNQAGVKLGPNKVFFRMDQKGESTGTLYMDMLYTPKKMERLAVGAKEVRFPLVIKAGLKIKQDKGVPLFVIKLADIDTSDETLLNGVPAQGVVSSLKKLRFKKKVLEAIRTETAAIAHQEVLELRYPELRGLGLNKVDFVSDGLGRMNALLLLKATND